MFKVTVLAVILSIAMSCGALANEVKSLHGNTPKEITNYHQSGPIDAKDAGKYGMDNSIKKKKLDNYPVATIGEAFEKYRYFETRDWKVTQLPSIKTYIDFTGMFKKGIFTFMSMDKGVSQQGVEIKFVVYEDGRFGVAMISRVDIMTDGMIKRYPLGDTKTILDKIYANKEIKFPD